MNGVQLTSWEALKAGIVSTTKAMLKWVATNPFAWIGIAAGAVVTFIGVVNHFAITAEKLNEQLQELKATEEELISTQDKLTEIDNKIAEIQSKGTLSITDNADISRLQTEKSLLEDEIELLKIRKELQQDEYNKNAKRYADGQYSNYTHGQGDVSNLIKDYKGYKAKSERTDIDPYFVEDAKEKLKETKADLIEYRNTLNENIANLAPDDEESRKKLETIREAIEKLIYTEEELVKIKFDRFIIDPNNTGISEGFEKIKSDGEVTAQEITDLASKFPTLKKFMDDNGISAETLAAELNNVGTEAENSGENLNKMTVSLSDLEGASDKIGKLSSAFKELSDDGYITFKTLGEIKEATGLADDEWEQYQTKLMNAKAGSAEFNQTMSELTYKILDNTFAGKDLTDVTEDQIASVLRECGVTNDAAIAHDYLTKKKAEEKAATYASQIAEGNFTGELAEMAHQCGVSTNALGAMILKQMQLQNAKLNLSQQIGELNRYINTFSAALGIDTSKFGTTKSGNTVLTRQQLLDMGVTIKTGTTGKEGYSYKGKWYNSYNEIQSVVMPDYLYGQLDTNTTPPPIIQYGGGGSGGGGKGSGGSDKNTPDYEDPTDAVINRINLHQRELKQDAELIESNIDLAESEKDYAKAIELTNDLIKSKKDRISELTTANDALHNEAEYLRNNNPWDEESWFDSQGNATEAYYNLLNSVSTKEEQEQIEDLFEKLSKYKESYKENAEEILAINKEIIDDEETLSDLYKNIYEGNVRDIEHARDMFLEQNPLGDPTSFYKQLQEEYHKEAERLRALDPEKYKEEIQELQNKWWEANDAIVDWRWNDSQNWISDRNTYNDWALFDDSEVDAWERVVKWLKEEYPNDLEKIKEAEQSLFEARKKEFNKANDFGSSVLDSRKTLLQSYYDVTNSIAEAQHEINKELETSKTMYEYLDEETRKLLFNQEDYNILSEELYDIQYKADKLQRQYERDLENSTLNTIEEITSNYQMQYETLMKSYEVAKADLEIAKKKQKLNNVLNERNVRMFINGQWQWVANTEDVINAKSELADAEYAKRVEESGLAQQESINNLTKQQDELGVVIKNFENGVIDLDEAIRQAVQTIGDMPNALMSMYDGIVSGASESVPASGNSGSSKYDGIANTYKANDYAAGIDSALAKGDLSAALTANKIRNDKIDYLGLDAKKWSDDDIKKRFNAHADGTRYTPGGATILGENGFEAYISSDGHLIPINQPTIGNIGSGGVVFNADQMKNLRPLWDLSNLNFGNSSFMSNIQPQQVSHTQDNRIIINGLTVDSGSTDGQALISALRRYVGNH